MLHFAFKNLEDGLEYHYGEDVIDKLRKKGVKFIGNFHFYVTQPLEKLEKGARCELVVDNTNITLELVGCYFDYDSVELYKELGIDIPCARIF